MDTLIGSSVGGYVLVKLLGVGGMGSVYLANDPAIGQQVAVKLIRTDLDSYTDTGSAQAALERFRQEARAVASLDHLHILPLYRYGEEETPAGPRAYMIMQYRPEGSLWDWLRRRADLATGQSLPSQSEFPAGLPTNWPLGLEEVADYLHQAASALQYAHDRGIVHRDIKPANFLLRIDSHEKLKTAHLLLSDFGLAKVFTASSATNTILGTPTYMAPEQFEGATRPESDQYALAVMVYYLLAGRTPFEGDPMQLMRQHLVADVPSLTTYNPEIPPYMNGILARALAKRPEQRYPSIAAFSEAFSTVSKPLQSVPLSLSLAQPIPLIQPPVTPAPLVEPAPRPAQPATPRPLVEPVAPRPAQPATPASAESAKAFPTAAYSAQTEMDYQPVVGTPKPFNLPANNPVARRQSPPDALILPGVPDPAPNAYNAAAPATPGYQAPGQGGYNASAQQPARPASGQAFVPTVYPQPGSSRGAQNAQTPAAPGYRTPNQQGATPYNAPNNTPNAFANAAPANAYVPQTPVQTPQPAPGYRPPQAPIQNNRSAGQNVSRRGALGWIVGTVAVLAAGGAGGYYYFKHRLPDHAAHVLKGHNAGVTGVSWQPGGTQLASASLDQTVRLWSSTDGSALQTLNAPSAVRAVAWSPDGNTLAAGEEEHSLSFWDGSSTLLKQLSLGAVSIRALAWRNNNYLFVGTNGESLHAVTLPDYTRYGKNAIIRVTGIALSPDSKILAMAVEAGVVYFFQLTDKDWIASTPISAQNGAALAVAWSPDGNSVAVGYANQVAIVYDVSTKQAKATLTHNGPVNSLAWLPSTTALTLATGVGDNTVNFWDLSASSSPSSPTATYQGHSDAVLSVAWSSDGKYLASASNDKTAIIWQAPGA